MMCKDGRMLCGKGGSDDTDNSYGVCRGVTGWPELKQRVSIRRNGGADALLHGYRWGGYLRNCFDSCHIGVSSV